MFSTGKSLFLEPFLLGSRITHPPHSQTSRLLTSCLSVGVPVPSQPSVYETCRSLNFGFKFFITQTLKIYVFVFCILCLTLYKQSLQWWFHCMMWALKTCIGSVCVGDTVLMCHGRECARLGSATRLIFFYESLVCGGLHRRVTGLWRSSLRTLIKEQW